MPAHLSLVAGRLRRAVPGPGTAALLTGLGLLVWALRQAVVSPKLLLRAKERFALARGPAHLPFKWEDAAVLGTHYSTLIALGVLALAMLSMRWWYPGPEDASRAEPPPRRSGWFRPALLAVLILAAALRMPLASGSLWWDELWNVKYATVGEWQQTPGNPEAVSFQPTSWSRAAWYYNKPTNHPVLTLPSKVSHLLWQKVTGAAPGTFSEPVLRLPVLLGGLGALLLTAFLTRRLAGDGAGIIAATLMALHPWLIRYGVDARSYGLAIGFMSAALCCLVRATAGSSHHRNAWWWGFGFAQFLLMWSHVVANLAVCTGLFAAAAWLILRGSGAQKRRRLGQLLIINLTAAALLLVVFLPNLLQSLTWRERNDDGNMLTGAYFLRTLTQIAAGMEPPGAANPAGIPHLSSLGAILLIGGGLAATLAGARHLVKTRPHAAIMLLGAIGFTAVFLAMVKLSGFYFYHRFLLPVSIPLLILSATGLSRLRPPWLPVACLALFAGLTFPQTRLLLTRSYAPFRGIVDDMERETRAGTPRPILAAYGLGSHVMQCYCPPLQDIRSAPAATLQALMDQARRQQRPLLIALGYEGLNRLNQPDGFPLLDDPARFERISTRHGIEPEFTFHLLRLLPESGENP